MLKDWIRNFFRFLIPSSIKRRYREYMISKTSVEKFGGLWKVTPISNCFGFDRGLPIDRYYIEKFLKSHCDDIKGVCLEIAENTYTQKFGGVKVTKSEILHLTPDNPNATIIADLTNAPQILDETFDCIIFTQTLQHIFDIKSAIKTLHRILKENGVLLATFPGISQISRYDMERWGDYWRFTTLSAQKLFSPYFKKLAIKAYGNVLTSSAFLYGMASDELTREILEYNDDNYQLLITVRAQK